MGKRWLRGTLVPLALMAGCRCGSRPPPQKITISPVVSETASSDASPSLVGDAADAPESGKAAVAEPLPTGGGCEGFAKAYCDRFLLCTPPVMRYEHGTLERCKERWTRWCTRTQRLTGSGWSDALVEACGAAIEKRPCGAFRRLEDMPIAECHPAGSRANGAPCLEDAQCGSGSCFYDPGVARTCGRCTPRAKIGGDCWSPTTSLPIADCPIGAWCSRGMCLGPAKDEGQVCGMASAWATDCYGEFSGADPRLLECRGPATTADSFGICRFVTRIAKCPDGITCSPFEWCDSGTCKASTFVAEGMPCDSPREECLDGGCSGGKCVSRAKEGAACDQEVRCAFPLLCVAGKCALTNPSCG
jgi:hypothetical protein